MTSPLTTAEHSRAPSVLPWPMRNMGGRGAGRSASENEGGSCYARHTANMEGGHVGCEGRARGRGGSRKGGIERSPPNKCRRRKPSPRPTKPGSYRTTADRLFLSIIHVHTVPAKGRTCCAISRWGRLGIPSANTFSNLLVVRISLPCSSRQ